MSGHTLWQLALIALGAACLPLAWVWLSKDPNKYRKLIWITLFLTFDLIMFGAFTRLTDSGLGCPDWPGCYGHANPLSAQIHIQAAEAAMPDGPVTWLKAWVEMIHRYLAMMVGVLIIGITIMAWRMRQSAQRLQRPPVDVRLPSAILALVCLQGAFGAWTVTQKLQPIIVTLHLLLGMALLGLLAWLAATQSARPPVAAQAVRLQRLGVAGLIVLTVQIALGGWVGTNYAVLACRDFPLCQGELIPAMDFAHGFTLWRELGKTANGDFLPFAALTAIHWVHRNFAFIVFGLLGWLALRIRRIEGLQKTANLLLALLAIQFMTGMLTLFLNWPLLLAVLHNGGAAALVLVMVMLNFKLASALPEKCNTHAHKR